MTFRGLGVFKNREPAFGRRLLCTFLFLGVLGYAQRKDLHIDLLTYREGLSQSVVTCMLQDRQGYLWFGTQEGLNRFDGYRFTVYQRASAEAGGVSNDWIRCLFEDSQGNLWVGSNGGGLDKYDRKTDQFVHAAFEVPGAPTLQVTAIAESVSATGSQLWIGTQGAGLFQYDPGWNKFTPIAQPPGPQLDINALAVSGTATEPMLWVGTNLGLYRLQGLAQAALEPVTVAGCDLTTVVSSLWVDGRQGSGSLWVGGETGLSRLSLNPASASATASESANEKSSSGLEIDGMEIAGIAPHGANELWLATQVGVFKFNTLDRQLRDFTQNPKETKGFLSVLEDRAGVLWMGSHGHWLFRYDLNKERFAHYRHFDDDGDSIVNDLVFNILEDRNQDIWFSTGAGGLDKLEIKSGRFVHFAPAADKAKGMPAERFYALFETTSGELLLGGASTGLYRFDPKLGITAHYQTDPQDPSSICGDGVRTLVRDGKGRLWVGTTRGLCRFDEEAERFVRFPIQSDQLDASGHVNVQAIQPLRSNLMLATLGNGLIQFNPETAAVRVFHHDPNNKTSLADNQVLVLYADPAHPEVLWVGTLGGGLGRLDIASGQFRNFTTANGLPNNVVYTILADKRGRLWMSTNRGIARFNPADSSFTAFSDAHGLQGPEFSHRAAIYSSTGQMFFGGNNGVSVFDPTSIGTSAEVPFVVLTDFRLFNESLSPKLGQAGSPLKQPIWETREIEMKSKQNVFSFEFAALNPASPASVIYAYKLEGLHPDWMNTTAENRIASFTNPGQGSYTLRVRARSGDSPWREMAHPLHIRVKPPAYLSWWAYGLYVAILLALLLYYLHNQRKALAFERAENERQNTVNERLRQMDKMKDEILANTSHELRTPLHGIIGLADSLRDGSVGALPDKALRNLDMIITSGKRLTALVNDILDFSKLRTKKLELLKAPVNLYTLTEMVLSLSNPLLAGKDLELINAIPSSLPPVLADENRLQQILHNLVGNAIKFTSRGFVKVTAAVDTSAGQLCLQVIDTGMGISESKLETIFNAFEQADTSAVRSFGGTGLGLAITKHLVSLHGGTISVDSVPDKGSIFSFSLPLADVQGEVSGADFETSARIHAFRDEPVNWVDSQIVLEYAMVDPEELSSELLADVASSRILIVDDEPINRQVLVNYLAPLSCHLQEAAHGAEALELLAGEGPFDLILLDIMMPRMSGYEVCAQIRQSYSLNELPIIFLTAKNQAQDLVEGFVSGANDYLTKPIAKTELIARVRAHLKLLHFNRSLEAKVAERTRELRSKNSELDAKYHELETFNNIVKAINRAVELEKVVDILLEQGLVLFPSARAATFAISDSRRRGFVFTGAKGYERSQYAEQLISAETARAWSGFDEPDHRGVTILEHPRSFHDVLEFGKLPSPLSQVVLTISQEGRLLALMTLDNDERENAFSSLDFDKLLRFREHAVNAVARARVVNDLVGTQSQLVEAANLAGKAEIATNVLHNVGNTLNSVRTSLHMIQENMCSRKWLNLFQKIVDMLHGTEEDLDNFFASPVRRQSLISALDHIWQNFQQQSNSLDNESRRLVDHVQSIVSVLIEQERHAQFKGNLSTTLSVNDVIEETIRMEAYLLKHKHLEVRLHFGDVPPVRAEKSKLILILFNLLKNSWQAIEEHNKSKGLIEISSWPEERSVWVEIKDNGIGVATQNLIKLCEQGFTTKRHCEGFGLHYVANTMHDMCGAVKIESEGLGKGCRVLLSFPLAEEGEVQFNGYLTLAEPESQFAESAKDSSS